MRFLRSRAVRTETRLARQERARELRGDLTVAETLLWEQLRDRKLHGLKFRRQVSIDRYVVDFYCPERKLVVELDGPVHGDGQQAEHDLNRDTFLRSRGLRILRLSNRQVIDEIERTLQEIWEEARKPVGKG
jgi:very-short-patch-repair endonuclease